MTSAERSGTDGMVERIRTMAVEGLSHPDATSLLHAYIALPDYCRNSLHPLKLRLALRRRLLRLLRDGMRAKAVGDSVWAIIRSKHPATYLYLCARLRHSITEAEALELVLTCPHSIINETRGLRAGQSVRCR